MTRTFLCSLLVLVCGFSGSTGATAAPPRREPPRTDHSVPAVERVLRAEMTKPVDRREELADIVEQHPDADAARWQSGYVRIGHQWRAFDDTLPPTELLEKYRESRRDAPATVAGQVGLADWCRRQKLFDQERAHLRAAMDLEPDADHTAILVRLGNVRFGNVWLSGEQLQQWQAHSRRAVAALQQWGPKVEKLAERLEGPPRQRDTAMAKLAEMHNPEIIPVLECLLCGRSESCAAAAVDVIAKSEGYESTATLTRQAVFSMWPSVRDEAVQQLKGRKFEEFVPALTSLLATPVTRTIVPGRWYYCDRPDTSGPESGQFVILSGYVLAQETENQFQVAVMNQVDYRLTEALQGYFVRFAGGFHLEPEHLPTSSYYMNLTGSLVTPQGQSALFARQLSRLDRDREAAAVNFAKERLIEDYVDSVNTRTDELNRRVIRVLSNVTGRAPSTDPAQWWQWWADFTDTQTVGGKQVIKVAEDTEVVGDPTARIRRRSCFAAGTPVWTETGPVAIETIRIGDRVLAQDVETGELAYKPVVATTVRPAKPLVQLQIGEETILATGGHRFWTPGESWTKARDLTPQSCVHTATGSACVSAVKAGPVAETYNLVVAEFHNYFVGRAAILVQDLPLPQPTDALVPGLPRHRSIGTR